MLIVGTQGDGYLLTSADLLGAISAAAASLIDVVTPPSEQVDAGSVNGTSADGASYCVALGDSFAAAVGVTSAADGYVSRFHNQLQTRNGASRSWRRCGISGETSRTLIRNGQLDNALAFINDNDISYITIDIGANDLLGHIGSVDCENDFSAAACQQWLSDVLGVYQPNIVRISGELRDAAPDATIIFLSTYNPFGFGFGFGVGFGGATRKRQR